MLCKKFLMIFFGPHLYFYRVPAAASWTIQLFEQVEFKFCQ